MFLGNLIVSFHCRKDMQLLHQNVFLRIAYPYVRNDVSAGGKKKEEEEKEEDEEEEEKARIL